MDAVCYKFFNALSLKSSPGTPSEHAFPEQVIFEREELSKLRNVGPKGLMLLGFKPRSAIKRKHQLRHAAFLYPSDKVCSAG